jgi:pyrroloquinoline quinone (PQQ) biosynthesis protein C
MSAVLSLHDVQTSGMQAIRDHEIFCRLATGQLTTLEYVAFLREMYHLVKHTPSYLKIAADRVGERDGNLRDFFLSFAADEAGHELLCVHDLRVLGVRPEAVLPTPPGHGAWSMITQNYYLAAFGNAAALLGDTLATEALGAELAGFAGTMLVERCGIASAATTFLQVHGHADVEHVEKSRAMCEQYGDSAAASTEIAYACVMTLRSYLRLCDDVLAFAECADAAIC